MNVVLVFDESPQISPTKSQKTRDWLLENRRLLLRERGSCGSELWPLLNCISAEESGFTCNFYFLSALSI